MRFARLRKFILVVMTGGCMYATVSCYPNRDQINSSLAGGLMNGIELAITLAVENLVSSAVGGLSIPDLTGTNTDTTTTQ
jgi:hypothetical protein